MNSILLLTILLNAATRVTPINTAEAVFAPCWDAHLNEIKKWEVSAGEVRKDWHVIHYKWSRKNLQPGQPAFKAVRADEFSCKGYDTMICVANPTQGTKLRIDVETDRGIRSGEWIVKKPYRDEYLIPLNGAQTIRKITFQVFDEGRNKATSGTLLWMGLQNKAELDRLLEQRKQFASQPMDVFLAPRGTIPAFKGRANLLAPAKELEKLQAAYQKRKKELGRDFITDPTLKDYHPEALLSDTLPYANAQMFGRIRDDGRRFMSVRALLEKGLVTKNPEFMNMAVRTALVYALTPNWDSMFLSVFPDSGWDQRVFSHSAVTLNIALVLDYAYDLLSPAGRSLLEKRIAVEGLGQINYNIWKYAYLFGNNQLAVFTAGRVAAYLILEKTQSWNGPRIKKYTELAMEELFDSIAKLVYEDGSYLEGPMYFTYTMANLQNVLDMYASARNKSVAEILPEKLKNLGVFADTCISTDRRGGLIPFSSGQQVIAHNKIGSSVLQFLALAAPNSQWVTLYWNETPKKLPWDKPHLSLRSRHALVPKGPIKPNPLSVLPTMGVMASTRFYEGETVKMLLIGTKAQTRSHRHNDRGSFVLEFAGDTYAADPGGQSYSTAGAGLVKRSDYHNMLVPGDMPDNELEAVAKANVYPVGTGDEKSFHAEILPAPSSYNYFTDWKRTIDSPVPNRFVIRDDYKLTPGRKSARFLWITELPWKKVKDGVIRLDGLTSYALIHYPPELQFRAEKLSVRRNDIYHRLNFEKNAPEGTIEIRVEFHKKTGTK